MKTRFLVRFLSVMAFLSGAGFVCGASYLQRFLPRHALEVTGNTIPRNIHGAFVYGTKKQWFVYDALFYAMLAFGASAALVAHRRQRITDKKASDLRGDDKF